MTKRAFAYIGRSAASGVLGWVVLMAVFEAAYAGEAWVVQWKRKRSGS